MKALATASRLPNESKKTFFDEFVEMLTFVAIHSLSEPPFI